MTIEHIASLRLGQDDLAKQIRMSQEMIAQSLALLRRIDEIASRTWPGSVPIDGSQASAK